MATNYSDLNIIYHYPRRITDKGISGSQVRPYKMLKAFKELGANVVEIIGDAPSRCESMRKARERIREGEPFDFVYSENLTIPFAMSEDHRFPLHPLLDHRFLAFCSNKGIPVSMFYRDAFWRDTSYREMLPWYGRAITIPLYWFDWWRQLKYVNTLYLPSEAMGGRLPLIDQFPLVKGLPPGSEIANGPDNEIERSTNQLRLFYVGGIEPPTYDLRPLLRALLETETTVSLTICCREKEWNRLRDVYGEFMTDNVKVVHKSGIDLAPLYNESDLFAIVRNRNSYLDFAVPTKVYESVGYGLPILCCPGDETARRVTSEGLGWAIKPENIATFLDNLNKEPNLLKSKKRDLIEIRNHHTWKNRAAQVCKDMAPEVVTSQKNSCDQK